MFLKYDIEYFYSKDGELKYENYFELSIGDKIIDFILGKNIFG